MEYRTLTINDYSFIQIDKENKPCAYYTMDINNILTIRLIDSVPKYLKLPSIPAKTIPFETVINYVVDCSNLSNKKDLCFVCSDNNIAFHKLPPTAKIILANSQKALWAEEVLLFLKENPYDLILATDTYISGEYFLNFQTSAEINSRFTYITQIPYPLYKAIDKTRTYNPATLSLEEQNNELNN